MLGSTLHLQSCLMAFVSMGCLFFGGPWVSDAIAQDNFLTPQQLQARLDELRSQLDREKKILEDVRASGSSKLEDLRRERDDKAGRVLAVQMQREHLALQEKQLQDQWDMTLPAAARLESITDSAVSTARSLAEKLQIYLYAVPGSDDWVESDGSDARTTVDRKIRHK